LPDRRKSLAIVRPSCQLTLKLRGAGIALRVTGKAAPSLRDAAGSSGEVHEERVRLGILRKSVASLGELSRSWGRTMMSRRKPFPGREIASHRALQFISAAIVDAVDRHRLRPGYDMASAPVTWAGVHTLQPPNPLDTEPLPVFRRTGGKMKKSRTRLPLQWDLLGRSRLR
jgi:hypothetical protein